jgi:hypothetical protein
MGGRFLVAAALVTVLTTGALTACTAPPAVSPGKPAPSLPADSVAYDDIAFQTTRQPVFDNACASLPVDALRAVGLTSRATQDKNFGCTFWTDPKGRIWIQTLPPPLRDPDAPPVPPFATYWNGANRFGASFQDPAYFQRMIMLDRYYATQVLAYSAAGPDCETIVDTGSEQVFLVAAGPPDNGTKYDQRNHEEARRVAADFCPRSQQIAEKLLAALDPDGGSLAAA